MQAVLDENEALRARVSLQRRELRQVNKAIRLLKLELEVLKGRGTVETVYMPTPQIDPSVMFQTYLEPYSSAGQTWTGVTQADPKLLADAIKARTELFGAGK